MRMAHISMTTVFLLTMLIPLFYAEDLIPVESLLVSSSASATVKSGILTTCSSVTDHCRQEAEPARRPHDRWE